MYVCVYTYIYIYIYICICIDLFDYKFCSQTLAGAVRGLFFPLAARKSSFAHRLQ